MINFGDVPAGTVLYVPFATFNSSGASVTITGLAVTDIEIYKNGSITQRASDAGYTLLDTDGIDFDGITGIHGFSIDTADNTDAGFFAVGSSYFVVVSSITADSQTVNFIAATFRLIVAENTAGTPVVDVGLISNDATAADNLENAFDDTAGPVPWLGIVDQGTAQSATTTTLVGRAAGAFANDTIIGCILAVYGSTQAYWQVRVITDVDLATDTFTVDAWTVTPSGTITYKIFASAPSSSSVPIQVNVTQIAGSAVTATAGRPEVITQSTSVGAITSASFGAGAIDAAAIATGAIDADAIAADAVTEIQSGLATAAALDTVDNFLDTEVAAILALLDDPRTEPGQGAPPVNPDLATKIDYLYKAWRNRSTQTSSQYSLYADDATTIDQKAAVSSDGTTLSRGEVATGP